MKFSNVVQSKIEWFLAAVLIFLLFVSYAVSASSIVSWGEQVIRADHVTGFTAIASGGSHILGLKGDGFDLYHNGVVNFVDYALTDGFCKEVSEE